MDNKARYFATATGRVQGVGFRHFVNLAANRLRLAGWVKNMPDGTVTMEVEGSEANIQRLWEIIRAGNAFIKVSELAIKEREFVGDEGFHVLY